MAGNPRRRPVREILIEALIGDFAFLPSGFRDYLRRIEELVGAEIAIVSTGVERRETVFREGALDGLLDVAAVRGRIGA